jgi:hypothetical protein
VAPQVGFSADFSPSPCAAVCCLLVQRKGKKRARRITGSGRHTPHETRRWGYESRDRGGSDTRRARNFDRCPRTRREPPATRSSSRPACWLSARTRSWSKWSGGQRRSRRAYTRCYGRRGIGETRPRGLGLAAADPLAARCRTSPAHARPRPSGRATTSAGRDRRPCTH